MKKLLLILFVFTTLFSIGQYHDPTVGGFRGTEDFFDNGEWTGQIYHAWYGVEWDVTSSDLDNPTSIYGNPTYASNMPVHVAIKYGCIKDDKSISYYLDETDFTKKADGSASDLSGADGQVMMILPTYYEKWEQNGTKVRYMISEYPLAGFEKVDQWAIGLFEASYTASGDTLQSVANDTADTDDTRAQYRAAAAKRGSGWCQLSYYAYEKLTMLYLVEEGNWNSQAAGTLGTGATNAVVGDWSTYNGSNPVFKTGENTDQGAYTGSIAKTISDWPTSPLETQIAYYRGVENVFGHLFKFVDGINIYNRRVFTCTDPANFADNDSTNYTYRGTAPSSNSWISKLFYETIIPQTIGGSASTYQCDYYFQSTGWRVACWGGDVSIGTVGGLWTAYFNYSSVADYTYIGARLCLKME